jgi:hypothetical protein
LNGQKQSIEEYDIMKIRRKKMAREKRGQGSRADLFQRVEAPRKNSHAAVAQTVLTAAEDLQCAIKQARATVAEAEQAIVTGTHFQEAIKTFSAASKSASHVAANSAATGEVGARHAIQTMLDNLQRISNGFSNAAASEKTPGAVSV